MKRAEAEPARPAQQGTAGAVVLFATLLVAKEACTNPTDVAAAAERAMAFR
jgi:hypothetical protein